MTSATWSQVVARRMSRHGLSEPVPAARLASQAGVTYTSPATWVRGFSPVDADEALGTLACRYLWAYGPATARHLAQWLSIPKPLVADLIDRLAAAGEVSPMSVDGTPQWVVDGDTAMPDSRASGVRLLPYFDAYGVGSHPRADVFPGEAAVRALSGGKTGGQAGTVPLLLIDGIVAGVWHQRRSGHRTEVTVEPLRELSTRQRSALDDEVGRVGEILEATPSLTIGPVTIGNHL